MHIGFAFILTGVLLLFLLLGLEFSFEDETKAFGVPKNFVLLPVLGVALVAILSGIWSFVL